MVRIKQRYLLVNILYPEASDTSPASKSAQPLPDIVYFRQPTPDDLTPQLLVRAIRESIALFYGDYGVGVASNGLAVKYLSNATSTVIVRCSREHFRLVWAALTWMTHLPKASKQTQARPCIMRVVKVSGTIRKAEEEAIRRAKAAILEAKGGEDGMRGLDAVLGQDRGGTGIGTRKGAEVATGLVEDEDEDEDEEMESD